MALKNHSMRKAVNTMIHFNRLFSVITIVILIASCSTSKNNGGKRPIAIREQGSFTAGGTVITNPGSYNPYKPDG